MARQPSPTFTGVELEIMHVLWDRREAAPEDIVAALAERGRDVTGGTVRKMLSILIRKGYASRTRDGKKYLYCPAVKRSTARKGMVADLMERAFGGSAALMAAALLDDPAVPEKDLDRITQLIEKRKGQRHGTDDDLDEA